MTNKNCFHCGEPIPEGVQIHAQVDGQNRDMCCIGCQAVAQYLNDHHHQQFYQFRAEEKPHQAVILDQPDAEQMALVEGDWVRSLSNGMAQCVWRVDGMYCSACAWLIDKVLSQLPGVHEVHINSVTHRVQVTFLPDVIQWSEIHHHLSQLGYQAKPAQETVSQDNKPLKQLLISGIGMMFIMTMSVPLYSETLAVSEPVIRRFFVLLSLLVATVVYFYSGQTFVNNAIRGLKNRHLGMDVPVALSISLAYFVSVYLSFTGQGHVFFDSMTMFIFFLLLGRYVEQMIRQKSLDVQTALMDMVPISAVRVTDSGTETVPIAELSKGDVMLVQNGETVAADGQIIAGWAQCNESVLTGESKAIEKGMGQSVYAGAQVIKGEVKVQITKKRHENLIAQMAELIEKSQGQKPVQVMLADRIASHFVAGVLVLAAITMVGHMALGTGMTLQALLAVLIATCPCALSLATPTAMTAAGVNLIKQGILINRTDAITQLHQINHWFFDKTGTLTDNEMRVVRMHDWRPYGHLPDLDINSITAALQQISDHPIASAFPLSPIKTEVSQAKEWPGQGVSGMLNGATYYLGSRVWLEMLDIKVPEIDSAHTLVYLSNDTDVLAVFELSAQLRQGASDLIKRLQKDEKQCHLISGDGTQAVASCAQQLGINHWRGKMSADDKKQALAQHQPAVMVGDGVNDAPVLAAAQVSIALKQGATLAHAASDWVVLGGSLKPLTHALKVSSKTHRIIKQNLAWALLYNLSVTPMAMMGLLPPWLAAVGMSASSLWVVLNSRRVVGVKS